MGLPLPQLAFAGLGGLAFGYDLAVVAGAGPFIKNDLNLDDGTLEAVVALAKVGACCGVVLGAISMDLLGRQLSMTAVGFFFFLGPILIAVSGNVGVLCFGRFLAGIAIGMSSECCPCPCLPSLHAALDAKISKIHAQASLSPPTSARSATRKTVARWLR